MRRSLRFLICCGLALAAGCGPKSLPAPAPLGPLPSDARLYYDNAGGIQDSLRLVLRSEEELHRLWDQATSTQQDPPPVPSVDWGREMLLVAAAGRMTPEGQIRVDSVGIRREMSASGDVQEVLAAVVTVLEGCRRFDTSAYPLEIVRVRRFDGPVSWVEERKTVGRCSEL